MHNVTYIVKQIRTVVLLTFKCGFGFSEEKNTLRDYSIVTTKQTNTHTLPRIGFHMQLMVHQILSQDVIVILNK